MVSRGIGRHRATGAREAADPVPPPAVEAGAKGETRWAQYRPISIGMRSSKGVARSKPLGPLELRGRRAVLERGRTGCAPRCPAGRPGRKAEGDLAVDDAARPPA